ncbi:MAG: tRNA (adenosine(37)-N6)-dimethylallyltransferase MiaA, partial [Aeriscardovia sp.]|nr:tRNA (adenosine(37)-N6)-dimethylallyltransferase MiaA [Aeriscardovia sp.]
MGPTASGKSELAIEMAKALFPKDRCEIVSQDAYQIYRFMDIGTAKPEKSQLASVPHHMIDIKDPWQESSAASFQKEIRQVMQECADRGVRPILVGGSGLYARSAVDDLSFKPYSPLLRSQLEEELSEEGSLSLWKEIEKFDPAAAKSID